MKITKFDYSKLAQLINATLEWLKENPVPVQPGHELNYIQHIWNIFHITRAIAQRNSKEDYEFLRNLSNYLNDDHIETALRKIIPNEGE